MDLAWDDLDKEFLDCDPAKELDWCRREHLEYSTPARFAHYIVSWKKLKATSSNEVPEEHSGIPVRYRRRTLPKRSDPIEQWREFLEWRLPRIDLNLLQLAVIFNVPHCISYLSQTIFMRTEDYRDKKSVLVNHPLHLACSLGWPRILSMTSWSLPDEVFLEEGIVDLSQARIQWLQSPENQEVPPAVEPSANGFPASSTGSVGVANENALLALMGRNNVTVSQISLLLTPTMGTCFSLTSEDDDISVTHLFLHPLKKLSIQIPQPQSSTVECLMKTVGNLCRRGMTDVCFGQLMCMLRAAVGSFYMSWQFPNTLEEGTLSLVTNCTEITMLACQLSACVAEDTGSWAASLEMLSYHFLKMSSIAGVESVQRAASYLPRKHLSSIVRILQERRMQNLVNSNLFRDPQLTDMAKETILKNLCVLKVLESVRGDARAARSLTVLPEPLRELFHVPFQDLYDQLTAGNQT